MTSAVFSVEEARRHARETVRKSGTSFGPGMRILSKPRRDAMYAVYAFCREVDDIADNETTCADDKLQELTAWREEIDRVFAGTPEFATGHALVGPVREFNLPRSEFILMIEGMETDARAPVVAPTWNELFAYTRRVAGAAGQLSMPIFGAPSGEVSDRFAISLGDALQLTNILRDVESDAEEGRLYLPRELLLEHNCPLSPEEISHADGLPKVREYLAIVARRKFDDARAALSQLDWRILKPALLMMGVYERYLDRMETRGWMNGQPRMTLSKSEKLSIAAQWYFWPKLTRTD
jgi:phytoene synthase